MVAPKSVNPTLEEFPTSRYAEHRTMIGTISQTGNRSDGVLSSAEVDARLGDLYSQGWELFAVHFIGLNPSGASFAWTLRR